MHTQAGERAAAPDAGAAPPHADAATPTLWRRPEWMNARLGGFAALALVIYGSLLPFDMAWAESWRAAAGPGDWLLQRLSAPQMPDASLFFNASSRHGVPAWVSDVVTNVLLYVPLGGLLLFASRGRGLKLPMRILGVTALLLCVSYTMEVVQDLSPHRTAAVSDLALNVAGGLLGACLAVPTLRVIRRGVFSVYCRFAGTIHAFADFLNTQRYRPATMFVAVALNVAVVGGWIFLEIKPDAPGKAREVNVMPFQRHLVERSYDEAAFELGGTLMVYCVVATLLCLKMLRRNTQRRLLVMIVIVAGVGIGAELFYHFRGHGRADVTEPILAAMAVLTVLTTAFLAVHAVRCSCRRKRQIDVPFDRRSRPHDYRFAVAPADSRTA